MRPKPELWYSTDVADIPHKRQFIENPKIPIERIPRPQPGQSADGAQAVQPINTSCSGDLGYPVHRAQLHSAQLVSAPWPAHSARHGNMDQPVHNVQHSHVPRPGDAAWPIQLPQPFQHNIRQAVTGPAQAVLPHESAVVLGKLGTASELHPFDDSDDHGRSSPRPFSWSNAASTCSSEDNSTEALWRVWEADHKDHPPAHPANAGDCPVTPHSCHISAPEAIMMDINRGSAPYLPRGNHPGPIRISTKRTAYPSPCYTY